jgi:3-deoxy-7-phosphoheptulonate synthase
MADPARPSGDRRTLLVLEFAPMPDPGLRENLVERARQLGLALNLQAAGPRPFAFAELAQPEPALVRDLQTLPAVRRAWCQSLPWILAGRHWQAENTRIPVGPHTVGGGDLLLLAGPCSVESQGQILGLAGRLAAAGAHLLRGGAFKPRSNPYSFQGLRHEGLALLQQASRASGLPVITEVMSVRDLDAVAAVADVIQVGARLCQHFELLHELGHIGRPVLLKRGFGTTLEELLLAAEHIMAHGNAQVMLCERGIRTFEPAARFTFDLNAIPILKQWSHLPVIADPSHATGDARWVAAVARGAAAAGADGLILEVHEQPAQALSDGSQSLTPDAFARLRTELAALCTALGRRLPEPARGAPTPERYLAGGVTP